MHLICGTTDRHVLNFPRTVQLIAFIAGGISLESAFWGEVVNGKQSRDRIGTSFICLRILSQAKPARDLTGSSATKNFPPS